MIDRDVKNVQVELDRLAQIGLINFEEKGQRKRPVVWFDEFVIQLAFEDEADGATTLAP